MSRLSILGGPRFLQQRLLIGCLESPPSAFDALDFLLLYAVSRAEVDEHIKRLGNLTVAGTREAAEEALLEVAWLDAVAGRVRVGIG